MRFELRRSLIVSSPRLLRPRHLNLRKIAERWKSPWRSPGKSAAGFVKDIASREPRLHNILQNCHLFRGFEI